MVESKFVYMPALAFLVGLALTGCGMKQNPTAGYQGPKHDITPQARIGRQVTPQSEADSAANLNQHSIWISPEDSAMVFYEGKRRIYHIDTRPLVKGIRYQLVLKGPRALVNSVELKADPSKADPGNWDLVWTPPAGLTDGRDPLDIKAQIFAVTTNEGQNQKIASRATDEIPVDFFVTKSKFQPVITRITFSEPNRPIKEGTVRSLSVQVYDPTSTHANPPRLEIVPMTSKKNPWQGDITGANFVQAGKSGVQDEGRGYWMFYRTFDTTTLSVPSQRTASEVVDSKADGVYVEFGVIAKSGTSGLPSLQKSTELKVEYNPAWLKPQIIPNGSTLSILAGEQTSQVVNVMIHSRSRHGILKVNEASIRKTLTAMPIGGVVKCTSGKSNKFYGAIEVCTIRLPVFPCASAGKQFDIEIAAAVETGGPAQKAQSTIRVNVKDTRSCQIERAKLSKKNSKVRNIEKGVGRK